MAKIEETLKVPEQKPSHLKNSSTQLQAIKEEEDAAEKNQDIILEKPKHVDKKIEEIK